MGIGIFNIYVPYCTRAALSSGPHCRAVISLTCPGTFIGYLYANAKHRPVESLILSRIYCKDHIYDKIN